jgi:anti-sigma-K factor RskA
LVKEGSMSQSKDSGEAVAVSEVAILQRRVSRWRVATWLVGMAAISFLFVAIGDRMVPSANSPRQFVAVLTAQGSKAAFVATINLDAQTLVIRRLTDPQPADRSYQLWAMADGSPSRSLGVIEQARYTTQLPISPANLTLAVTLEPKGGSPTGMPTGPIVFSGTLVAGT